MCDSACCTRKLLLSMLIRCDVMFSSPVLPVYVQPLQDGKPIGEIHTVRQHTPRRLFPVSCFDTNPSFLAINYQA